MCVAGIDRAELKKAVLELLKSDEEFRLAVAGLLGLATTPFCGEVIYSVF